MSKFDRVRALADIAGGAATQGATGAARAAANMQRQVCEDNADAWAVKFISDHHRSFPFRCILRVNPGLLV